MQGREEANWQESVAVLPVTEMLEEIIDKGYMGVYFDTTVYEAIYGEGTASDFINSIREQLGDAYITNDAGTLYFWGLEDYIKNGNGVTQDVT